MENDVLSFNQMRVEQGLLSEVWKLDPRAIEHIDGALLSTYAVALSQYLIYFTYQRNLVRAEQHRINKYIDRSVSLLLTKELEKKYKTKASVVDYIISTNEDLMEKQTELDLIYIELIQTEGMDKAISDLISTLKRELTRRENELYQIRLERRN